MTDANTLSMLLTAVAIGLTAHVLSVSPQKRRRQQVSQLPAMGIIIPGKMRQVLSAASIPLVIASALCAYWAPTRWLVVLSAFGLGAYLVTRTLRVSNHLWLLMTVVLLCLATPSSSWGEIAVVAVACTYLTATAAKLHPAFFRISSSPVAAMARAWRFPRWFALSQTWVRFAALGVVCLEFACGLGLITVGTTPWVMLAVLAVQWLVAGFGNAHFGIVILSLLVFAGGGPKNQDILPALTFACTGAAVGAVYLLVHMRRPLISAAGGILQFAILGLLSSQVLALESPPVTLLAILTSSLFIVSFALALIGLRTERAYVMFSNFHPFIAVGSRSRAQYVEMRFAKVPSALLEELPAWLLFEMTRPTIAISSAVASRVQRVFDRHGAAVSFRKLEFRASVLQPTEDVYRPVSRWWYPMLVPPLLPRNLRDVVLW